MQIIRVQNPDIVFVPAFIAFMREAVKGTPFMGGNYDQGMMDFAGAIMNPRLGVFLGEEDGQFRALAVVALPQDRLLPLPSVLHAYNRGSKALANAMMALGLDFLKENGYNRVVVHNGSGKPDKVWARVFRKAGTFKPLGALSEVVIP